MRIGELLRARGLLDGEAIEAILKRQVVTGGRFGTCAVELGYLDLDTLAEALAEQHGLPAATARHFARADQAVMRRLDDRLAARHRAIPLGYLKKDPAEIAIASIDPLAPDVIAELSEALEAVVVPAIAPELRVLYYLESIYGIERMARFRRAPSGDHSAKEPERRGYVRTLSKSDTIEPPTQLARIAVRQVIVNAPRPRLDTVSGGVEAVYTATRRDQVGDYIAGTLEHAFDERLRCGLIFTGGSGLLLGWKGFVRDGDNSTIDSLALGLDDPSMLRQPFLDGVPYFGAPPAHPLDRRLWEVLGLGPPAEIAVVPVVLRSDVVAVIYADAPTEMDAAEVGGLAELGQSLAAAFDRLVEAAER